MKRFILKKISVLFILSILAIVLCFKFFIFDFRTTEDFGFAGIGALIFFGLGLFGLLLDYILSLFIKNRIALNIIELIMVCMFLILIWLRGSLL